MIRDSIFSLMHDLGLPGFLRRLRVRNQEISVLMFHRVSDERDVLWPPMPIRSFRSLMRELAANTHVVALEKIHELDRYTDKPLVALTFDDGYLDFWENALPILSEWRLPVCHNVCPGLVDDGIPPWTQLLNHHLQVSCDGNIRLPNGKMHRTGKGVREIDFLRICDDLYSIEDDTRQDWIDRLTKDSRRTGLSKLMNWSQIRDCVKRGVHIGSHGMKHCNLSKIANGSTLSAEIKDSRKRIFEEVGVEPAIFAFPSGQYDALSRRIVAESGYRIALLCDDMAARFSADSPKEHSVFPRINIGGANWKEENLRLLGFHQRLKSLIKRTPS